MRRIVVGISGASGMPLAVRLLQELKKQPGVEVHLVISCGGKMTLAAETGYTVEEICSLADVHYDNQNIGGAIASGSYKTDGMIVIPCAMKTIAGVAHGYADNLLLRACDVTIKEKRKLLLVARETPLSPIHLDNLAYLAKMQNVMIMPPMLTYYNQPQSIEDMETHLVGKILGQFDIAIDNFKPWGEDDESK
ncbi:MAG: UbiX family flavin prenyltransferase [Lachnospiraceae bacterium]